MSVPLHGVPFRRAIGAAAVVITVGAASCAGPGKAGDRTAPEPTLELSPCHLDRLAEQVQCGVLEVYEDREAAAGRRIPIHVAVLPSLRRRAEPDPLFILAGGPGQGARSYASIAARYFKQVRRTRAIVLVDLRGTGASGPLTCPRPEDEMQSFASLADAGLGFAAACAAQLDADPRHYTHQNALADLDEVRRRLGYETINLWGGSWGTRAALLYALRYPESARRLVLDGAVPLDLGFPRSASPDADRALEALHDRCMADPSCAETFPDGRSELDALLQRLDAEPHTVQLPHPRTGAPVEMTMTRAAVAEVARVALYTPTDTARLLQIIRHGSTGDFGPLAAQAIFSASFTTDGMALGATMAILCSEDLPLADSAGIEADAAGSFGGTIYADVWRERCRSWPAGPGIPDDLPATSPAPALILSGRLDPVTPLRWGEVMARHFSSSRHVVVPGAAHNASFTGCVPDLIATFLASDTADPIDDTCASDVAPPPIVTGDHGGWP
jgi:pimeloyl-ACP methyl ester carboxylesterase